MGWFYNSDTEQCQFGGCEGRGNIFTSMADCVGSCGKSQTCIYTKPVRKVGSILHVYIHVFMDLINYIHYTAKIILLNECTHSAEPSPQV